MSPALEGNKSMILKPERWKKGEGESRNLESDSRVNKVSETAQEKITVISFTGRENALIY